MKNSRPARNPFRVLGVDPYASDVVIRQSYRELAKKYHPDQNHDDPYLVERFKELTSAYETVLSLRKKGDGPPPHTGTGPGRFGARRRAVETLPGSRFSGLFRPARTEGAAVADIRGEDVEQTVRIGFMEAITGALVTAPVRVYVTCGGCHGSGAQHGAPLAACPKCQETGHVLVSDGGYLYRTFCPICLGSGRVIRTLCRQCKGQGRVKGQREVQVEIPPGVEDGARFIVMSRGDAGVMNGPAGDIIVIIAIEKHPVFFRRGANICVKARVPFTTAALGGHVCVPTLTGTVRVTVPPNTRSHTLLRLKNRGVNGTGDQYVKVIIDLPARLTEKEKRLLESFAHLRGDPVHAGKPAGRGGFFRRLFGRA